MAWGYTRARACQKSGHLDSSPTRQLSNVKRSNLFTEGLEVEVLLLSTLSLQRSREVQSGLALGTLKRQVQHPFPPVCTLLAIWGSFLVATGLVCPFGIQPAQRITEQLPLPPRHSLCPFLSCACSKDTSHVDQESFPTPLRSLDRNGGICCLCTWR